MDLNSLKELVISYYKNNGKSLPISVSDYIKDFPPGYSRQVLSKKYGLKTSELLSLINPLYVEKNGVKTLIESCKRLNYAIVDAIPANFTSKDRINIRCNKCGYINNTTTDSLRGSTKGCIKCTSGNLSWDRREEELKQLLLDQFNSILISTIPSNQTGYITVKHLDCDTEYTSQLVGFISPNTPLRATCPNCRTSDRRVTDETGITFGSQFELDCYNKLKHLNPEIHVLYKKYFNTNRRWVCDFKIGNKWIEVSNFKQDFKDYFQNIEDKRLLVEDSNQEFFFIRSIKELDVLINKLSRL